MTFSDSFAIERFRELLKVDTISHSGVSSGSYSRIAEIIQLQCIDAGLTVQTVELVKGKPLVIATKLGSNPSLSSLLLSGHYDVVPVDFEKWTVPPFDALVKDGKIYGRGTQDMKCCLAAYIESMKRLIANSFSSERSIHLLFLPDEEIGGWDGMGLFVQTDLFKSLNVGFALDEGLASATSQVPVYFGERALCIFNLI